MTDREQLARRVAQVVGPESAAAAAIAELERRRSAGEVVEIFRINGSWIVGPPLPQEQNP